MDSIYFILIPFAIIGAIMAHLITYNEYVHHYATTKEPRKIALTTGLFTLIFLIVLGFLIIYALLYLVK